MLSKGSSCCCSFDDYKLTTEWLQNQTRHRPKVAVICGSGLGLLAEAATDKQTFRYQDIPNFPVSTGSAPFLPEAPPLSSDFSSCWRHLANLTGSC
ncbi:purine nucleoside phosphorylase-like isoform X1 [Poecilia reticulata]|uniref:purine nucleoside phosphorylase-like isoform X1 n=1 Tax=Poecilia reticulata TaxID=8081 RepID=UPI0007EC07F6|nr:PREDICTED: purine nucleoside phosphorylase-like isoform X1 [Poecilia reticulata]